MNVREYNELVKIADSGDSFAKNSLGVKLAHMGENYNEASLFWYLEAVEDGFVESIWNAGTMIINGEGCQPDIRFGKHLIEASAKGGSESASLFLSYCYEKGLHGYSISSEAAREWKANAFNFENETDFVEKIKVDKYLASRPTRPELNLQISNQRSMGSE